VDGGFALAPGENIDPVTEPVTFSVGSYALRLPVGSFVRYNTGYVYQKTVNGIFVCIFIKFASTPGRYVLLVEGRGVTPPSTSPVAVTLIIGNNGGSTNMSATLN